MYDFHVKCSSCHQQQHIWVFDRCNTKNNEQNKNLNSKSFTEFLLNISL